MSCFNLISHLGNQFSHLARYSLLKFESLVYAEREKNGIKVVKRRQLRNDLPGAVFFPCKLQTRRLCSL